MTSVSSALEQSFNWNSQYFRYLNPTPTFVHPIHIFDFFAGAGIDSVGTRVSPLLILENLLKFNDLVNETKVPIRIYLNDMNKAYSERLERNVQAVGYNKEKVGIVFTNKAFRDAFVSFSIFNRFSEHESIQPIPELSGDEIKKYPASKIHRVVAEKYQSFIPLNVQYRIAPFSIKKRENIYGENIDADAPSLFSEMSTPSKIHVFVAGLASKILSNQLRTDREIFLYAINNGFSNKHIEPVIAKLKSEQRIIFKQPSFRSRTVWVDKQREPKKVEVL